MAGLLCRIGCHLWRAVKIGDLRLVQCDRCGRIL